MHSVNLLRRAHERRGQPLRRVVLGASAGLLILAAAAPVQAAPAVRVKTHDGVLSVIGTPFSDSIVVRLAAGNPAVGEILVDNDRTADFTFNVADVQALVIDGGRGDDRLSLDTSNGAFPATLQTVLFGGPGNDELEGGLGHQVLIGGSGDDRIDGNQGADDQFGGTGNDTIVWDPGDGSDLVDGGPGLDTMQFNGSGGDEIFHASQNGDRVRFTRNLGNIVMDVHDTERIDLNALGGADTLTVDPIAADTLQQINTDLGTDGAVDAVSVNGTAAADTFGIAADAGTVSVSRAGSPTVRISGADAAFGSPTDTLTVAGLGGADTFNVGQGVTDLIQLNTID